MTIELLIILFYKFYIFFLIEFKILIIDWNLI